MSSGASLPNRSEKGTQAVAIVAVWTGHETRILREALRMTIRGFAEYLGVAVRTVAKWEAKREAITPLPVMQAALDTALAQAPEDQHQRFRLLLQGAEDASLQAPKVTASLSAAAGYRAHGLSASTTQFSDEENASVDRRTFLALWPLPLAAATRPMFEKIPEVGASSRPSDVRALARTATVYASRYDSTPTDVMTATAALHLIRVRRLLDGSLGPSDRSAASSLLSEAASFLAWLSLSDNHKPDAARHFALAAAAAEEASDATMLAAVLASQSELAAPAHPIVRPRDPLMALDLARSASETAPLSADPRLRSWIAVRYGVLSAVNGDAAMSGKQMERAWSLLEETPDGGQSGFYSTAGRFATWDAEWVRHCEAISLYHLGRLNDARELEEAVLQGLSPAYRNRGVNVLTSLALIHTALREPAQALDRMSQAMDLMPEHDYPLGMHRVKGVRRLLNTFDGLEQLADFDNRLLL